MNGLVKRKLAIVVGADYAAAWRLCWTKASRSALIVSASVVGMPCGKPL